MSHHTRTNSHNHRTTDASITNHHAAPSEIFALIDTERILVTIAPYGWRTYIRRETPDEYAIRYENAAGVVSGELQLDRQEARQLVTEKCQEAVWVNVQDRTAWPGNKRMEGRR